jgi:hypothetical protein
MFVTPAKAGVQAPLDSGFRRNDGALAAMQFRFPFPLSRFQATCRQSLKHRQSNSLAARIWSGKPK